MTIRILRASDVSIDNEVINLRYTIEDQRCVLSAASFLVASSSCESLKEIFKYLYDLLEEKLPEYEVWFLIGNSAWQPDTRIIRYRGLWGALKLQGLNLLGDSDPKQVIAEFDGKLKFFGGVRLSSLSAQVIADAILEERCSYLVAMPESFDVEDALALGWTGRSDEDLNFYQFLCEQGCVLIKRVGEFDDVENGFVSIGLPDSIGRILD